MAVLCNNVIAGASVAEEAAGGFQIEKSIRFNRADSPYFNRTFRKGNRRTWTWSCWVKRSGLGEYTRLFENTTEGASVIRFRDNDQFGGHFDSATTFSIETSNVYRDPSAWYHLVVVTDTTNAVEAERGRLYVNGRRISDSLVNNLNQSGAHYPTQNEEVSINNLGNHVLGGGVINSEYLNGYMADPMFIDGLALSPAAFGSFDSTGVWNPKEFSLPAPNDGTTWSGKMSGSFDGSNNATKIFDGSLSTYGYPDAGQTVTFTPDNPISCTSLKVYARNDSNGGGVKVNGEYQGDITTTPTWYDYTPDSHSITTISWKRESSGSIGCQVYAIEIDDVILIDGKTDPATLNNVNNNITWSSNCSYSAGGVLSGYPLTNAFDGKTTTDTLSNDNNVTLTFTPSSAISATTLEVQVYESSRPNTNSFTIGGTGVTSTTLSGNTALTTFQQIPLSGSTIGSITVTVSGNKAGLAAIKIDGHILVDGTADNSYHLKFNDTTAIRKLGKDTLNGKIADATGGKPILTTTDEYGDVKGSGTATDSDSSNLLLAVPFDSTGATDYHATIKGSGTNRTFTNLSTAYATTADSRFYGASANMDVNANRAVKTSTNASDFEFGTGDFTIEWWAKYPDATSSNGYIASFQKDDYSGNPYPLYIYRSSNDNTQVWTSASQADVTGWTDAPTGTWNHYALVRSGSGQTWTTYLDGGIQNSWTTDAYDISTVDQLVIGGYEAGSLPMDGYIQDFRIYNKAKYTGNFKTPTRNDFTVNNIHLTDVAAVDYSGTHWSGGTVANLFDGDLSTPSAVGGGSSWHGHTFTTPLNGVTKFEVRHSADNQGQDVRIRIGSTWQSHSSITSTGWNVAYNGSSIDNVTEFGIRSNNGGGCEAYAVRVNDSILVNVAATDNDSSVDTPTNYGTDTGAGGEVRGNYCTINPLSGTVSDITFSQGNLSYSATNSGNRSITGCTFLIHKDTGKYYFEHKATGDKCQTGIQRASDIHGMADSGHRVAQSGIGTCINWEEAITSGSGWTGTSASGGNPNGSTLGIAIDTDDAKIWFYKDGVVLHSGGNAATGTNGLGIDPAGWPYVVAFGDGSTQGTASGEFNFGQKAFKYTAPSGFKALCTQNLVDIFGEDELNNPSKYFDIALWRGNGTAGRNIKGLNFGPDMVWCKRRDSGGGHHLFDQARGAEWALYPHGTSYHYQDNSTLTAFNSDGFTIGNSSVMNSSSSTTKYVGWCWDAGTAAVGSPSTDGSITPSAQWVNATAGLSISKFTGNDTSGATVGHGLGEKPEFVIIKNLTSQYNGGGPWVVGHQGMQNGAWTHWLRLDDTPAEDDNAGMFNDTAPSNTIVTLGGSWYVNESSQSMVMYAWTPIPGFSKFGTYTGTGSASTGAFLYMGFTPKFMIVKKATGTAGWPMLDSAREQGNTIDKYLYTHSDGAEGTNSSGPWGDIVSNGFRIRDSGGDINGDGETYIYAAWAEHPFKTSRAR